MLLPLPQSFQALHCTSTYLASRGDARFAQVTNSQSTIQPSPAKDGKHHPSRPSQNQLYPPDLCDDTSNTQPLLQPGFKASSPQRDQNSPLLQRTSSTYCRCDRHCLCEQSISQHRSEKQSSPSRTTESADYVQPESSK
jgi:hypothetical protein